MERDNAVKVYESMQSVLPTPANAEAMSSRACDFWRGQQKILESMRDFAGGWFERRQAGTQAAMEAAQRIYAAKSPLEVVREYQGWASGSLQRMADDSLALQREMMGIAEALIVAPKVPEAIMPEPVGIVPAPNAQDAAQ